MGRPFVAALFVLGLLAAPFGAFAQETNRVLVVIDDELVTQADLEREVRQVSAGVPPAENAQQAKERETAIRRAALKKLVEGKLFSKEAKRLGLKVPESQIDSFINNVLKRNGLSQKEFAAQLSRQGLTIEEFRDQIRQDLLQRRVIANEVRNKVVISDEQVADYFKKHPGQYDNLDKVRFRALFLPIPSSASPAAKEALKEEAEKLRGEAAEKKNLAELARKYSKGPGAESGGEVGPLAVDDLDSAMRQALAELKPGQLSPVVEALGNFIIMQLVERSGQSGVPLGSVKEEIRKKLEREAFEKKLQTYLAEVKERYYVKYMD